MTGKQIDDRGLKAHPSPVSAQCNMREEARGNGREEAPAHPSRQRVFRRDVFVLLVIACLLLSLVLTGIQSAREAARRMRCANWLRQISVGLLSYHSMHATFPPAYITDAHGQRRTRFPQEPVLSSWRVAILPFIDSTPFHSCYSFEEPWDSQGNLNLALQFKHYCYRCPSDGEQFAMASYFAVTGESTAWPGASPSRLEDFTNPFHSILVAESANAGIHWMEPRDLEFARLDGIVHSLSGTTDAAGSPRSDPSISSRHPKGANVLFTDGSAKFLAADTSPDVVKGMLVIRDGPSAIQRGQKWRIRFVDDPGSKDEKRMPKPELYLANEVDEAIP